LDNINVPHNPEFLSVYVPVHTLPRALSDF
jgi:hypothetical protein